MVKNHFLKTQRNILMSYNEIFQNEEITIVIEFVLSRAFCDQTDNLCGTIVDMKLNIIE